MDTYQELLRENSYLKSCLELDNYVYAVCIGVTDLDVKTLGCVKFLDGVDHYRSRDKMFTNIKCKKFWALVDESVFVNTKKGRNSFVAN